MIEREANEYRAAHEAHVSAEAEVTAAREALDRALDKAAAARKARDSALLALQKAACGVAA